MSAKQYYGKGIPGVETSHLKGKLIVIEGSDGSGRSTQISMLCDWLERRGYATVQVGLKRSPLVGEELATAMEGNVLGQATLALFYATDFADQLENVIIPALRSDFIVLADRYIFTLMARAVMRGLKQEWLRDVYSIALVPDAVFYLEVTPRVLAERTFRKNATLDYWESGMDIQGTGDMYQCFIRYQRQIQRVFRTMQQTYNFETVNGNRQPRVIAQELQAKIEAVLNPQAVARKEP